MRILSVALGLACISILAGCASQKPKPDPNLKALTSYTPIKSSSLKTSKVSFPKTPETSPLSKKNKLESVVSDAQGKMKGRTLYVSSVSDINLRPGEIILTFDDGPVPKKTDAILSTLDNFGVKATFLMVGSMVNSYPNEVKKVIAQGHSIGSHTTDHANLAKVSFDSARSKIRSGEKAIMSKTGMTSVPFFRFPYLASTPKLRQWLAQRGVVVLDVDIDSKDYFKDSSTTVAQRTINRVKSRGSGIILFHDIHARTVAALPNILRELSDSGFKVVTLKANRNLTKDAPVIMSYNGT